MYMIHGFLDDKKIMHQSLEHLPRKGDTIRFSNKKFGKVLEIVWCLDEPECPYQRINLRMKSIKENEP